MGGAILASTDPVVLREIVRDQRVPRSVRQVLKIEAGMNDMVVLPVILLLIALAVVGLGLQSAGALALLAGALLYLAGSFLVPIVFNVPRNDALASVDPSSAAGAALWASYLTAWTAWNHVRTAAALSIALRH